MKKLLPLLAIFSLLIILYSPILGWFFARDDFNFLPYLPSTLENLPKIWIPPTIWFFRPVSQQFYFWLNTEIWGLNPTMFRLVGLLILSINSVFIFKIIIRLSQKACALPASLFYALSTMHLFGISWIAAQNQTIVTFFFTATILLTTSKKYKSLGYLTLILAFLSNEIAVFIAPVLILLNLADGNLKKVTAIQKLVASLKHYWKYVVLTGVYGVVYVLLVNIPGGSDYGRTLSITELAKTLTKYALYPLIAGFDRANFLGIVNILMITRIIFILAITTVDIRHKKISWRLILTGGLWFLVTMPIYATLSNHTYAYLDAIPGIGVTMLIFASWKIFENKPKLLLVNLGILLALSISILVVTQKTDPNLKWLNDHQIAAKNYLKTFNLPADKKVIIKNKDTATIEATCYGRLIRAYFWRDNPEVILVD